MIPILSHPLRYLNERVAPRFVSGIKEPLATHVFFKVLVGYTLIKMILVWPMSRVVMSHHSITMPRSFWGKILMGASYLADRHVDMFFWAGILFLVVVLLRKGNYVTNIIFFWLTFNLYTINLPFTDGSDVVLFMLGLWAIPMATLPRAKTEHGRVVQYAAYNLGVLLCQLQVVYIYVVSGTDKLMSATWRSGEAFEYIRHLEALYNPILPDFISGAGWNIVFSWSTLTFELLFVVLVWIRQTRVPILFIGLFFHLCIWFFLSLPDFALVMIVSYFIFLKDTDYERIRGWIKR